MDRARPSPDNVRSLVKGLAVLRALNEHAPARIATLVAATGLPKPTLIRILNTLLAEGYVAPVPKSDGGGYQPTPKVRLLSGAFAQGSLLAQIARPLLVNVSLVIKWPVEVLTRDGLSMLIEASSRESAPITLKRFDQTRFPLLRSGAGLVYLAWLPKRESAELIAQAMAINDAFDGPRLTMAGLAKRLEEIRAQGWGPRDYEAPIQGTRAISLPILMDERPLAVLATITLRQVVGATQFERRLLPHLKETAREIVRQYGQHTGLRESISA
ncbi:MAG: helix-turn-helix domain-containing protein [Rhodospirillales bacterium]|nr:helix-turn-helix domain-containing protein [Rhodospirillales bacterium]